MTFVRNFRNHHLFSNRQAYTFFVSCASFFVVFIQFRFSANHPKYLQSHKSVSNHCCCCCCGAESVNICVFSRLHVGRVINTDVSTNNSTVCMPTRVTKEPNLDAVRHCFMFLFIYRIALLCSC